MMDNNLEMIRNFYNKRKILITGCSGFKGTWMTVLLKLLGADVDGISLPNNSMPLFREISSSYINWYKIDVNDMANLEKAIINSKPDVLFHFAANGFISKCHDNPVEAFNTNVIGTVNILEILKKMNYPVSVVIVTTDKVYENNDLNVSFVEEDKIGSTLDIYSTTKSCVELVVKGYRQAYFDTKNYYKHKKAIAIARASNVLGPGDHIQTRIVPSILNAIDRNEDILLRNPNAIRPYQNIFDLLYGYLILAKKLYVDNVKYSGEWNFGPEDKNIITTKQLVEIFLNKTNKKNNIKADKNFEYSEANVLKLNSIKAKEILGWFIRKDIEQTVDDIIEYHFSTDKLKTANSIVMNYLKLPSLSNEVK